jgi:hypothetical protein
MEIVIVIVCLGAVLNLAVWRALARKLDGLPAGIWNVARKERTADEGRAMTVLQEAASAKAGPLLIGIRSFHDQLYADLRAQLADAKVQTRIAERRSIEAGVAFSAASVLVRELRETLDAAKEVRTMPLLPPTLPPAEDGFDDDEKTRAGKPPCIPPPSGDVQSRSSGCEGAS